MIVCTPADKEDFAAHASAFEVSPVIHTMIAGEGSRLLPPNPSEEGYHWVRRYRGAPAIPLRWDPVWHINAGRGWGSHSQPERENRWEYIAPCHMPEEGRVR